MISVVLCTYNGEKYIEEQLRSVCEQTTTPDEIIICDDKSTDNTLFIVNNLKKEYCDIRFVIVKNDTNQGVVKNFLNGCQKSTGDYIFFCDQDDVWLPEKIKKTMAKFHEGIDLVFCNAKLVDASLRPKGQSLWESLHYIPGKKDVLDEMLSRNIFTGMCMAIRRELYENNPAIGDCMLHDEFYGWISVFNNSYAILNEELVLYRQHDNNVVGSGNYSQFNSKQEAARRIIESTKRTRDKYEAIQALCNNYSAFEEIKKAKLFYDFRVDIQHLRGIGNAIKVIRLAIAGYYNKYTSRTERAIGKDLYMIIVG